MHNMNIGYSISGPDNDSFMCSSTDVVHENMHGLSVCPECGYRDDFFYINRKFRVKRRVYDFSSTYDGYSIISRKFKEFCERRKYQNIVFAEFENDPDFFALIPLTVLAFDVEGNKPRYEGYCGKCGNYESVIGPFPVYLKNIDKPLKEGIYRTDLLFGSGNDKSPLILIGPGTKEAILSEGFKDIDFESITT